MSVTTGLTCQAVKSLLGRRIFAATSQTKRTNVCAGGIVEDVGIILGCYSDNHFEKAIEFTASAKKFDKEIEGGLRTGARMAGPTPKVGQYRLLYGLHPNYSAVALVGIGDGCLTFNEKEERDEYKEVVRIATGVGAMALQDIKIRYIHVEDFESPEAAAEGSSMGIWVFQEFKQADKHKHIPKLELYDSCEYTAWQIGLQKGSAQNITRQLAETPSNILTPIGFAQSTVDIATKAGVSVEVKVKAWIKLMEMNGFMAASGGSCEPPVFVELSYFGCDPDVSPIVLIGKGATFNSGGLCLKECSDLKFMRGDMTGAAVVVAAIRAASALHLPVNIRGLIPLYENMPGNCAMKAGDIVRAKNGKTILIEDTDYDGRLALADAITHAGLYAPRTIIDIASISRDTQEGVGDGATIAFSNNDSLFDQMRLSGMHTGDRVWRMPLWNHYTRKVNCSPMSDTADTWLSRCYGDPCAAASFLYEFVPGECDFLHMDIFGTFLSSGRIPYLRKGMSGRPVRTIIEFLAQLSCMSSDKEEAHGIEEMSHKCASGVRNAATN